MELLDCGHPLSDHLPITTGYARTDDGRKICYACADARQTADLLARDKYHGYLSMDGKTIDTWTGGTLVNVVSWTIGHNLRSCRTLQAWSGQDTHGQTWYGKCAGRGMITAMHKSKARASK